jgi:adenylylsulfate kinase
MTENIFYSPGLISREERESLLGQKGCVVWMTGLSGSGKSTVAKALEKKLVESGRLAYLLDGDNIRHGLNADLGFSHEDRVENLRRISQVATLFADAGVVAITAFISPFREDRRKARSLIPEGRFFEVFINASLEVCESRDPKGLYQKARRGEVRDFTGIDSPYELPEHPEIEICSGSVPVEEAVKSILETLKSQGMV